jgi:hypothetical protein
MEFIKTHLCALPNAYAVSCVIAQGKEYYLFAADDKGPCLSIDALTHRTERVWEGPGGTMSIVPIPDTDGEFLAVQNFMPGFHAKEARIVRVKRESDAWKVNDWMELPYVHRFDILERGGVRYLLCCILSGTDKPQADWNSPGYLLAAELSEDCAPPKKLTVIADGMRRNHGYWRMPRGEYTISYTSCEEGVFEVVPPAACGQNWSVRLILEKSVSDIALCDIDGDGLDELATIEPFHGTDYVIYHQTPGGDRYEEWYRYPGEMAFAHVVWGGALNGAPVFLGGCRALNREFFGLIYENGKLRPQMIETGFGPSNVKVLRASDGDRILTANRESAECALFLVR